MIEGTKSYFFIVPSRRHAPSVFVFDFSCKTEFDLKLYTLGLVAISTFDKMDHIQTCQMAKIPFRQDYILSIFVLIICCHLLSLYLLYLVIDLDG